MTTQTPPKTTAADSKKIPWLLAVSSVLIMTMIAAIFFLQYREQNRDDGSIQALAELNFYRFATPRILSETPLANLQGEVKPFAQHAIGWRLVNMGYLFCPDICPINLALLHTLNTEWKQLQQHHAQPIPLHIVHLTLDPARDTPALLRRYLDHIDPEFYGLTGELKHIRHITQQLNTVFIHEKADEQGHYFISHSDSIALINPAGQYIGLFKPPYQQHQMMAALQILLATP